MRNRIVKCFHLNCFAFDLGGNGNGNGNGTWNEIAPRPRMGRGQAFAVLDDAVYVAGCAHPSPSMYVLVCLFGCVQYVHNSNYYSIYL